MIDEFDDDIERVLAAATPRKAPWELRAIMIAAVAAQLDVRSKRKSSWQSTIERAVAASVLFSLAIFLGVASSEARRMAAWDERPVIRSDVAELAAAVALVSDEESARGVERYLLSRLQEGARPPSTAMRREMQEIQRWAEGEPVAERSRSDEEIKDRI